MSDDLRYGLEEALKPFYPDEETRSNLARWFANGDQETRVALSAALVDPGVQPSEGEVEAPPFTSLSELLAKPELLRPPECVLPHVGYRGRMTMLAAPEKGGKSTLLAHGAAALTQGLHFLGGTTEPGRVLWVGLEEALGDAVRRFKELGADPERVQLVTFAPTDLWGAIRSLLKEWPVDLLAVDSLAEYGRVIMGKAPDSGDASGWGAVVRPLVSIAREFEVAIVVLHHASKATGNYRDSTEIGAAMDAFLEMSLPGPNEDPHVRHISGRGRWHIEPFDVALQDGRYELSGGKELSLDALLLIHIEQEPGISVSALREKVGRNKQTVISMLSQLEARGAIEEKGTERRKSYYPPSPQTHLRVVE